MLSGAKRGYMKKLLLRAGLVVIVLLVAAFVVSIFFLGGIVKSRVEAIGPQMTKGTVTLDGASVWLVPGGVQLKGVFIGNPPGYKSDVAIKMGEVSVHMNFLSALSDKMVVGNITMKSPEITVEGGLKKNNLTRIQKNINDYVDSGSDSSPSPTNGPAKPAKPAKKYQVNELNITGARLHIISLLGTGKNITIPLPDIHLANLGSGPDGITSPEIAQKALNALVDSIAENAAKEVSKLGADALSKGKKLDFKKAGEKMKQLLGQ
jgi:uncharacterized protein involved in outer membrane biogenesis